MLITSSAERNAKYRREQELKRAMFALGNPTVDQKYITDFGNSASKFISDSAKGVSGVAFGQSQQALDRYNAQAQRLKYQKLVIEDFLERNAEKGSYTELQNALNNIQKGIDNVGNAYINTHNMMSQYKTEDEYNRDKITSQHVGSTYDEILAEINRLGEEQKKQTPEQAAKTQKSRDVLNNLLYSAEYGDAASYSKAKADLDRQIAYLKGEVSKLEKSKEKGLVGETRWNLSEAGKQYDSLKQKLEIAEIRRETLEQRERLFKREQEVKGYEKHKTDPYFMPLSEAGRFNYSIPIKDTLEATAAEYDKLNNEGTNRLAFFFDLLEKFPELKDKDVSDIIGGHSKLNDLVNDAKNENWQFMSENERDIYNYLFEVFGAQEAEKYFDKLKPFIDKRGMEDDYKKQKAEYDSANFFEKLWMNVESVPQNIIGGIGAGIEDLGSLAFTGEVNPYSPAHDLQSIATNTRGMTAESIDTWVSKNIGKWAGEWGANTYQALMSGLDAIVGGVTLGKIGKSVEIAGKSINLINGYGFAMGLGAVSQKAEELYERGATVGQIAAGSIASGVIEGLFETLSVELLLKGLDDVVNLKQFFKHVLTQRLVEASEEFNTEIANIVIDSIVSGYGSADSNKINQYLSLGMTLEEAKNKATLDNIKSVFWAAYSGFISGGASSYVAAGVSLASNKSAQKKSYSDLGVSIKEYGDVQELYNYAVGLESNEISRIVGSASSAKSLSDEKIGRMYEAVHKDIVSALSNADSLQALTSAADDIYNSTSSDIVKETVSAVYRQQIALNFEKWGFGDMAESETTVDVDGVVDDSAGGVEAAEESVLPNVSAVAPEADPIKDDAFAARGLERLTEEQKVIKSIGKALGREVVFDNLDKWVKNEQGKRKLFSPNGYFDKSTGKIYINISTRVKHNSLDFIIKHELTHFAETNKESYSTFVKAVKDSKQFDAWISKKIGSTKGTFDQRLAKLNALTRDTRAKQGNNLGVAEAEQEIIADFAGEMIFAKSGKTLDSFLDSIESKQRPQVIQFIVDFVRWLRERLSGNKDLSFELQRLESKYVRALKQAQQTSEQQKTSTESGGQYSFAGQKSRTADHSLLDQAIKLEEVGKTTPEEIRQQTGWFRGYDGKWRYEIHDGAMEVDTTGRFHTNPDIRRYAELFDKVYVEMNGTEAEIEELKTLDKSLKGVSRMPKYLGQLIEHQELFEAYPMLRDVKFRFAQVDDGLLGYYDPKQNEIVVSNKVKGKQDNNRELTKVLIHEIQHVIQHYEAFAKGSSPQHWQDLGFDLQDANKRYVTTAGEIEARNASDRLRWSKEARKRTRPDIDRTDVVFAENNEGQYNVKQNLSADTESVTENADGEPVAHSVGDGTVQFSLSTYEVDGRSQLREYLEKCVSSDRLTQAEMDEMLDGIEEIYDICKEFKDKYAPFGSWSDAAVVRDTHGKPVFSVVTPNGEYKMNLDFSLVCKKRRTLDAVFNLMADEGILDEFELGQKSIVRINEIIRKHGFETACSLCSVDAKRFRQAYVADSFVNLYNELVESLVPESERDNILRFDFSERGLNKEGKQVIDTWDNSRLDFSHLDKVMREYGSKTVEHKAAKYIKAHPEARKLLIRGEFMSSEDFGAVKTKAPEIMKLYNSKKGTGGPKAAFGDVQYLNEIIKKARNWTPNKAYMVGGVRIQSFSDYVPRMVFDYVQMIYDLAATKLPAHAYTKEALFVKQFGLTGVKINMSLIPAIAEDGVAPGLDKNGNYVWAGESFDFDTAIEIQNADGYTENCGTIAVGVSREHILRLLRDPNIRMVIPYHKSGLNPIVAHMNKIDAFTDYTNSQNTLDKDGKKVAKDFNFNKALHDMGENGSPKAVAKQYLDWCAENDYMPKFAEFSKNANYYKLLEDFNLYDKSGKYAPQREVQAVFPTENSAFGSMKELIRQGLEEDAIIEGKRNEDLPKIVDEIKRVLPKTEAEISEDTVEQATTDLEAGLQYSLPQEVEEEYEGHRQKALELFGTTTDFRVTGFTLPDGKTLKLSKYGVLGTQHRLIEAVYDDLKGDKAINQFIQEGNVRIKAAAPGIEIGEKIAPTVSQLNTVARLIRQELYKRGVFYLDITAENGDSIASVEYTEDDTIEDIFYDIKAYYERGRVPTTSSINVSWYSQFAYSLPEEYSAQMDTLYEQLKKEEIDREEYQRRVDELYKQAGEKYGTIPKGETVTGEENFKDPTPSAVGENKNVRRFVRTIIEGGKLNEEMLSATKEQVLKGDVSYTPTSNEKNIKYAERVVESGRAEALWDKIANCEEAPTAGGIATGEMLLRLAVERKDTVNVVKLTAELSEVATRMGQGVQALSLLKRMSGIGQLYYVQRTVDSLNKDLQKKHGNKAPIITIDESLAEQLAESETKEDFEITYGAIMNDIASQVPATFLDKWNAWRYMSMLTNPTTHVRNIVGNAVFCPAVKLKDVISTGLERLFVKEGDRSKSVIIQQEYKKFAKDDFENVKDIITGGGKMNPSQGLLDNKRIFNTKIIESIRKFNFDMLEKEDAIFLKNHYTRALGGYLQAQKINLDDVDPKVLAKAREYAILEAQKATYRDASAIATLISNLSQKNAVANVLVEGFIPFKKTPINIVKRGIEYSPIGLLKTLSVGTYELKKGNITASQYIDGIAGGLTGTAIVALGAFLSSIGWIKGGFDDEEEDWFNKMLGMQEYSVQIGGFSYTIDWAAPACMPFFMGATIAENYQQEGNLNPFSSIVSALGSGLEPFINLSMLNGIQDTINTVRYVDNDEIVQSVAGNIIGSYFSQSLPTLGGKLANLVDPNRRINYVDKTSALPAWVQSAINTVTSKVPFLSYYKEEYIDAWGEKQDKGGFVKRFFQNFLSPGYISDVNVTEIDKELKRLAKETGESKVFPDTADKYFKFKGVTKHLKAEEYTEYAINKGQMSADYINELINRKGYEKLTDDQKVQVISELYSLANAKAKAMLSYSYDEVNAMHGGKITKSMWSRYNTKTKSALIDEYFLDSYKKAVLYENNGGSAVEYYIQRAKSK